MAFGTVSPIIIPIAHPVIDEDAINAVCEVLRSGQMAQGEKVAEFEELFAEFIGTKYAIATSSGTTALHLALAACSVGHEDEIITTPFSFIASANSSLYCSARPVFVDIDEQTFNLDTRLIKRKITSRTKAIVAVHLYGQPCNLDKLVEFSRKYDLMLLEDSCQAHGAFYNGQKAGSFGIGCFSFYPTKNMTCGEGGMITTSNRYIAQRVRMLRNHGQQGRYRHEILGYNFRMTDIAAMLGIKQLQKLVKANNKRLANAQYLTAHISKIKGLLPPYVAPNRSHVFHQYVIRVTPEFKMSRDELQNHLREHGIGTAIHYSVPIHQQPLYRRLGFRDSLPVAEKAAREVLSLPVHPGVSHKDLGTIIKVLQNA